MIFLSHSEFAELYENYDDNDFTGGFILCSAQKGGCGSSSGYGKDEGEAWEIWNRGVPSTSFKAIYE